MFYSSITKESKAHLRVRGITERSYAVDTTEGTYCFVVVGTLIIFILLTDIRRWGRHGTNCCIPVATVVMRTRHNVTLYVHCLSCVYVFWFIIGYFCEI